MTPARGLAPEPGGIAHLPTSLDPRDAELLERLWMRLRVHNSDDFEQSCLDLIDHADGRLRGTSRVHRYDVGSTLNHWIVPPRWHVRDVVLEGPDGMPIEVGDHPLGVWAYSSGVDVELDLEELLARTASRPDLPGAVEFRFRAMYRHWEDTWGIALPHHRVAELAPGRYHLRIETDRSDEPMPLFEYGLDGASDRTIYLVAHLDHPGQVNDSLSGCLAALQSLEAIEARFPTTKFSYRVLLVPEVIGTVMYLGADAERVAKAWFAFCPNMTSHEAPLALCRSKSGSSMLDVALHQALREVGSAHVVGKFSAYPDCGDEICFDTVGYRIPTSTLSRVGSAFPAYHTSADDLASFLQPANVARHGEFVNVVVEALSMLERDWSPSATFDGVPCLSNPALDLYLDSSNVNNVHRRENEFVDLDGRPVNARKVMEAVLEAIDHGSLTILEIAYALALPFAFIDAYARRFVDGGLATAGPAERRHTVGWVSGVAVTDPDPGVTTG